MEPGEQGVPEEPQRASDAAAARRRYAQAVECQRIGARDGVEHHCRAAVALDPCLDQAHGLLGVALLMRGAQEESISCLSTAAALAPDEAAHWTNLGAAYRAAKQPTAAVEALRRATALAPERAEPRFNLANAFADAGALDEALDAYRETVRLAPRHCGAWINLGTLLRAMGRLDEAEQAFRTALPLDAGTAARHNLGVLAMEAGRVEEALAHYRAVLDADPRSAKALNNIGVALLRAGRDDEAERALRAAIALAPALGEAFGNLGNVLRRKGEEAAAAETYRKALALTPGDGLRIRLATLLPVIPTSSAALARSRQALGKAVHALADGKGDLHVRDPVEEIGTTGFLMSYHDESNRELATAVARMHLRACPDLAWTSPHCRTWRPPAQRPLHIGFVSEFFRTHAVGWFYHRILRTLGRDDIAVTALSFPQAPDALWDAIAAEVDRAVVLPGSLRGARAAIAAEALDVLVFTDVGMAPLTYFLGFARLAPVQCVYHGHPDTTGIPTFDYYLSTDSAEPEGAQTFYAEPLVRLRGQVTRYERPKPPAIPASRAEFGIPEGARLYLCPQSLFKVNPAMDASLARILRLDPCGQLVFVHGRQTQWADRLLARWRPLFGEMLSRVQFVPRLSHDAFMRLLSLADVMLDTWPHGGSNTSYQGFALGTPIVTLEGRFARGRYTAAHYRHMGVDGPVAATPEAYAELAVAVATDRSRRDRLASAIRGRAHRLFDDSEVVDDLADFLRAATCSGGKPDRWLEPESPA